MIDCLEEPKYLQLQMKVCRADFHGAIIRNIVVNVSSRFSSMNGDNSAQKFSKSILGYHKTKKKWHGPPSHKCREGKTSVVLPLKKHIFFMCVFPNKLCWSSWINPPICINLTPLLSVVKADCPSHVGCTGICLMETKHTLQIISLDNKLRWDTEDELIILFVFVWIVILKIFHIGFYATLYKQYTYKYIKTRELHISLETLYEPYRIIIMISMDNKLR